MGWSERKTGWEIRVASLVDPESMTHAWDAMRQQWLVVYDDFSLAIFMRRGGNALVEQSVAEAHLATAIGPSECVRDGTAEVGGFGFVATGHVPDDDVDRRAPSRSLRMQVLKRDGYRCVVCGRKAKDHIDIELHVHHLIPWRMDGPTTEENLVTLCGTCHKGLSPDYEPQLRELAGLPGRAGPVIGAGNAEFDEEVTRYRQHVRDFLNRVEGSDGANPSPRGIEQ
ncbi:HNH endonuclease [Nocardia uniformis]|uniref:HNH endonuclease n=1 Tax=Nocardia uniformis TaxID=53432 RepID=UPI00289378D1|nr:HNH endonuclease [Nocardia uniformis]